MSESSDQSDAHTSITRQKRKYTSWVWNHFTKVENNSKGQCRYCEKQFAIGASASIGKTKGTKSLSDHLKSKHAMEPAVASDINERNSSQEARKTKQQKLKDVLLAKTKCPLQATATR